MDPTGSLAVAERARRLFETAGLADGRAPDRITDSFVRSVVDLVLYLETAAEADLHPDDAIDLLDDVAVSLGSASASKRDQLVDSLRRVATPGREVAWRRIAERIPEWLDLTGADPPPSPQRRRFLPSFGPVMIIRKLVVVTSPRAIDQARRQDAALKVNRLKGRWEVPSQHQARRAAWVLSEALATEISIRVVPAPADS